MKNFNFFSPSATIIELLLVAIALLIVVAIILRGLIFFVNISQKLGSFYRYIINYVFSISISKLFARVTVILGVSYIKLCMGDATLYHEIVCLSGIYWLSCELLTEFFSVTIPNINLGQLDDILVVMYQLIVLNIK